MKVYVKNRRASYEYFLLEKYQAGLALEGWEVKSIRKGGTELSGSYIYIDANLEAWAIGLKIPKLKNVAGFVTPEPLRPKKLLLKKKEALALSLKLKLGGLTIVPYSLYTNERGFVKLEIWLAKGKKLHDKRKTLKERALKRKEREE